jgi:hypothetical protein
LLLWQTELSRATSPLTFGPQHEMGLGVRMTRALSVQGGSGRIRNSLGGVNEAGTWGKPAAWWDYAGTLNGQPAGIFLLPAADNSRPVWPHARDYGFLALNPTGPPPNAKDVPSVPFTLPAGETLRLKFGLLLYGSALEPAAAATAIQHELKAWSPR